MKHLIYQLLKYVIAATAIFVILRFVPENPISYIDIAMIVGSILVAHILLDYLCSSSHMGRNKAIPMMKVSDCRCDDEDSERKRRRKKKMIEGYGPNDPAPDISPAYEVDPTRDVDVPETETEKGKMDRINSKLASMRHGVAPPRDYPAPCGMEDLKRGPPPKWTLSTSRRNRCAPPGGGLVNGDDQDFGDFCVGQAREREVDRPKNDSSELDTSQKGVEDRDYRKTKKVVVEGMSNEMGVGEGGGIISEEMHYSQLPASLHKPLGVLVKKKPIKDTIRGEYGDWYLPPDEWYPPCVRPPICQSQNGCPVQPVSEPGYTDLREWDNSRRITPPDNISYSYMSEKLHDGR